MIDLSDLDRRVASAMGLVKCSDKHGLLDDCLGWVAPDEPWRCRYFHPTIDANDCRELERWAMAHGVVKVGATAGPESASVSAYAAGPGRWGSAQAARAEHGPTYDLVARVLALLAALEGEKP